MSVSRLFYDPSLFGWSDFDRLFDQINGVRSGNASGQLIQSNAGDGFLRPRMDLHEDREANKVTATFELPGLRKEDVHVDVHNGRLSISAETKVENEREQSGYAVRERRFGKFGRTLQLPQGVKEDEVKANLENGILTVTFPRSVPEVEPRKIKVD